MSFSFVRPFPSSASAAIMVRNSSLDASELRQVQNSGFGRHSSSSGDTSVTLTPEDAEPSSSEVAGSSPSPFFRFFSP